MLRSPRVWFGLAATAAFLALLVFFFVRADFAAWLDALSGANYFWVAPAVALYFLSFYFRALRWRFLLRPFASVSAGRLYPVVLVGYAVNNILPFRAGELVRSYYLSAREPVRSATAFATIVAERVADGLSMLFFILLGALFVPLSGLSDRVSEAAPAWLPAWAVVPIVLIPFAAASALIMTAALRPRPFLRLSAFAARPLPRRPQAFVRAFAARFIRGFEGLHRPGRLAGIFALTFPIWIIEAIMYFLVAIAFDLQAQVGGLWPLAGAIILAVALSNLGTAIPASQGGVGPFEFFTALTLVLVGVDGGSASAYAVVLHAVQIVPVIAAGLAHLAFQGVSFGELIRGRASAITHNGGKPS